MNEGNFDSLLLEQPAEMPMEEEPQASANSEALSEVEESAELNDADAGECVEQDHLRRSQTTGYSPSLENG